MLTKHENHVKTFDIFYASVYDKLTMKVAGTAIQATLDFAAEKFGKDAVDKILVHVRDKKIPFSQPVLISAWYPFEVHAALSESLEQLYGKGDGKIFWEIGIVSAEKAFKLFGGAAPKTPEQLVAQIKGVFWPIFYDFGSINIIKEGERKLRCQLIDTPKTRVVCQRVFGFAKKGFELAGAKNLKFNETACVARGQDCCEISATWDE